MKGQRIQVKMGFEVVTETKWVLFLKVSKNDINIDACH